MNKEPQDRAQRSEVTRLLNAWRDGKGDALQELIPLVYQELRRLAHHHMRGERPGHTLQTTAVIHEAFLKLIDQSAVNWENRAHFFGVASQLMRRILVDHARARAAEKRGGGAPHVALDDVALVGSEQNVDLIALDEALERLAALDPQQSRIVELRFFGGLTIDEAAAVAGISPATVKREWAMAKAWLYRALTGL